MSPSNKTLVWLHGEISTPPFSKAARVEAGYLLRMLQKGETLLMPRSRPMATIGARCHELRIVDETVTWRVIYRIDPDAIVLLEVFDKKSKETPQRVIDACKERIRNYES